MSRVTATASVEIAAPPAEVFAHLAEVRTHGDWSPKAYRVEGLTDGGPVAKGTQYTSYGWLPNDKDHRNHVEVSELDAPHRLVLDSSDDEVHCTNTFTVTASGSGSRVERVMDLPKPGGFVGLVFPVILRAVIMPDLNKGLGMLKAKVESSTR